MGSGVWTENGKDAGEEVRREKEGKIKLNPQIFKVICKL